MVIAWFYISFLPVSNIIPIPGSMMGERFIYFTFAGFIPFPVAAFGGPLIIRRHAIISACFGAILLTAWIVTDIERTSVWRDNRSFFPCCQTSAYQHRRSSPVGAGRNCIEGYRFNNNAVEGILHSQSPSPLQKDMAVVSYWYARALLEANWPAEVYQEFKISADLFNEPHKDLVLSLAEAASRSGDLRGALSVLNEELKKSGEDNGIWNAMGNVYLI